MGPWRWWSSGRLVRLFIRRSQLESGWSLQFLCKRLFKITKTNKTSHGLKIYFSQFLVFVYLRIILLPLKTIELLRCLFFMGEQCNQMIRLCFQYLAVYSNENLPKSIQIVPKWVVNFAQNQINLKFIAKDF